MKLLLAFVAIFLVGHSLADVEIPTNIDELEATFVAERLKFKATGVQSEMYTAIINKYRAVENKSPNALFTPFEDDEGSARETANCIVCRFLIQALLEQKRNQQYTVEQLRDEMTELCVDLNLGTSETCAGRSALNINTLFYIVENRWQLMADTICGIRYQADECFYDNPAFDFTINIAAGGAPITQSKGPSPNPGTNSLKIVQITDVHYDTTYSAGALAVCGQPACCRIGQGSAPILTPELGAGYWGDYRNCDSPWAAVDDVLEHVQRVHPDADMIYFTGDIIDHGTWETSIANNVQTLNKVYEAFSARFDGIPFFPILGNHEPHPVNLYAPSYIPRLDLSSAWIYDFHSTAWANFLPAETSETVLRGGFYSVSPLPGFRIIAMNNNLCYVNNHWILYDPSYLAEHLQWLHDELLAAETANEKVHILAHVPSGTGTCFNIWAREYRRIVERFHDIISGQFNGHTHRNEFNVFYSLENPQYAINSAFNGGSATAYSNVNPNIVVYTVDDNNYEITSINSEYYNLTEANENQLRHPIWEPLSNFGADFSVPNFSPAALDTLVQRLALPANRDELQLYFELKVKRGDPSIEAGCDEDCLLNHLCQIATTQFNDKTKCEQLTQVFRGTA